MSWLFNVEFGRNPEPIHSRRVVIGIGMVLHACALPVGIRYSILVCGTYLGTVHGALARAHAAQTDVLRLDTYRYSS